MALEEDLAEGSTSFHAASTDNMFQAAPPGASENLKCPICLDTIKDQASQSWCRHHFCFRCLVECFHRRAANSICQQPVPHNFCTVGDINSEVYSTGQDSSSISHTQGGRAGRSSEERRWHRSSECQHHNSYRRSSGSTHGGSHGGTRGGNRGGTQSSSRGGIRGGSRGGARNKSRSRYQRRHRHGHGREQQAHGYNPSSRRRRQQNWAQDTVRGKGRAPRTKQCTRASSRRSRRSQQGLQVSFIEPRATRSQLRRRSHSTVRQALRDNLRRMERDEGLALRHEWHIHTSSRRNQHCQHRRQVSYREPQVTRNQPGGRSRCTRGHTLRENPRRMEHDEGQLPGEAGIASPGRRRRRQQGHQVGFIEPRVTRSRTQGIRHSTQRQTLWENLRRMERDEGRTLRLDRDMAISPGRNERRQRGHQLSFT
ncbi:protein SON-like protein [Willisornis vidua]|uniref:Protein SON-like protein n=1 Tax=Willisornis vidua TaxID=1566151 RepID=A0ABQ9DFU8_9PASS|nr:protein SON-like protein [Willisornis vidua]